MVVILFLFLFCFGAVFNASEGRSRGWGGLAEEYRAGCVGCGLDACVRKGRMRLELPLQAYTMRIANGA